MARPRPAVPVTLTGAASEHLDHLAFRARYSDAGIGAAVVTAKYEAGHRSWDCIAGDRDEWHYLQVIGVDLGPFAGLAPEDIEDGIEGDQAHDPQSHEHPNATLNNW